MPANLHDPLDDAQLFPPPKSVPGRWPRRVNPCSHQPDSRIGRVKRLNEMRVHPVAFSDSVQGDTGQRGTIGQSDTVQHLVRYSVLAVFL